MTHESRLDAVISDAVDTCMADTGYLWSLLRDYFSTMPEDTIAKLYADAFDRTDTEE